MRVLAIMTGKAEQIATKSGVSGINKRPVEGKVMIGPQGLAGDVICDLNNHGGVDQAVYLFTEPDLIKWSADLGRTIAPGSFGENLLISGLKSADLSVGDQLSVGGALLEVTSPRIPCETLNVRMGDRTFGKRFMRACRPGFYARVLRPGRVAAGDRVDLQPWGGQPVTMRELFLGYPFPSPLPEFVGRCLAAPIHTKLREKLATIGLDTKQ